MVDQFLTWLVVVVPVALGLVVILVPSQNDDKTGHMRWRYALGTCLILYGGLSWWQQSRAARSAAISQAEAIKQTSAQVTKDVTKVVGDQYKEVVKNLTDQIGILKGQLAEQGKKVDVISTSNIVTGKNPIPVQVTNGLPTTASAQVENLRMSWEPETSTHNDAPYAEKVTVQADAPVNPVRLAVFCSAPLKYGEVKIFDNGVLFYGGNDISKQDSHVYVVNMTTQGTALLRPDAPLVVHLYSDQPLSVVKGERGPR